MIHLAVLVEWRFAGLAASPPSGARQETLVDYMYSKVTCNLHGFDPWAP